MNRAPPMLDAAFILGLLAFLGFYHLLRLLQNLRKDRLMLERRRRQLEERYP
jgi:hypothetical protein